MVKDKGKGLSWSRTIEGNPCYAEVLEPTGVSCNEPFGSRPEPGTLVIASILHLPPGEVPEGRARGVQDTATQVQSESER